jgi:DNA/RNA-binding domain of Phe-tRNA-synthetase-like protein
MVAAEIETYDRFSDIAPSADPRIASWRNVYQTLGAKPKKFLSSSEALITRVLAERAMPRINPIVDAYNLVSIKHVIPIGGEDWAKLAGDNTLKPAVGNEPFETRRNGEVVIDYPYPGEVIWADSVGTTCRRWNWRQCVRTAITPETTDAYFVFDILPPLEMRHAIAAADELKELLLAFSPRLIFETRLLTPGS